MITSSIMFGLSAMIGWGLWNFLAGFFSSKITSFKLTFFIQIFSFLLILLIFPFLRDFDLDISAIVIFLPIGLIFTFNSLLIIKTYSIGPVSIVSPIISVWAVVTAFLVFLFMDEGLSLCKLLGMAIAIIGVVLVSADISKLIKERKVKIIRGAKYAMLVAFTLGSQWFLIAKLCENTNWQTTNFSLRFWSAFFFLLLIPITKRSYKEAFASIPKAAWIFIPLEVFTVIFFNMGLASEEPAVVSIIASLSPVVTATLAFLFLKERMKLYQFAGFVMCLTGIVLLAARC